MKGEMRRGLPSPKILLVDECLSLGREEARSALFMMLFFWWEGVTFRNYMVGCVMWIMYDASCSARHE